MRGPDREPQSVNEVLLDAAIAHAVLLERLKAGEVRRIVRLLDTQVIPSLFDRLQRRLERVRIRGYDVGAHTTQRVREALAATNKVLDKGMGQVYLNMRDGLVDIARAEAAWQVKTIGDALPITVDLNTPSPRLLRSVVTARPFQGRLLRDWWKTVDATTRAAVRTNVQIGISNGETTEQIVRRLRGTRRNGFKDGALQTTRRNAASVVRTATNHVSTHAREATFAENSDIVGRVEWVSTLDSRTTLTCANRDGKTYPIGSGPRPPAHMGCRSTVTPVTKSFHELGIDLDELPAGARATMDGQVPASVKYPEWFRAQPAARQRAVLGDARYRLFQRGVPLERMVDRFDDPLTVTEILEREGIDPAGVLGRRAA